MKKLSNRFKEDSIFKQKDGFILWLGQSVSQFGDSLYNTAIGFYILELTGSTQVLGIIDACSLVPRVFLSLIAGTFADRHNRKKIIVLMDLIRAVFLIILGILTISGYVKLWILISVSIILGSCGPFFDPAIQSVKPDIVKKKYLIKYNALFEFSSTGIWTIGRAVAGILVQILGFPIIFTINGLSFLFSGISEIFLKIPLKEKSKEEKSFLKELKEGLRYVYKLKGLRVQYLFIMFLNFLSKIGTILFIPLFANRYKNAAAYYGFVMMIGTIGFMLGSVIISFIPFEKIKKSTFYILSMIIVGLIKMTIPYCENVFLISVNFFISGAFISMANIVNSTVLQIKIPQNMRGKVYGFRRTMNTVLLPLGAIIGGYLGKVLGIEETIFGTYLICALIASLLFFSKSYKQFFNCN